jgi:predicted helicase
LSPITKPSAPPHQIATNTEKQTFLKVIYEGFYKIYNKKAVDRLGVVYTPNEIVGFMVESTDWLCQKHFGKSLIDRDVQILDPARGTGTFICELLEHRRAHRGHLTQTGHGAEEQGLRDVHAVLPLGF